MKKIVLLRHGESIWKSGYIICNPYTVRLLLSVYFCNCKSLSGILSKK